MNRQIIIIPFLFIAATFFAGCGDDSAASSDVIGKWIVRETAGIKAPSDESWYEFKDGGKVAMGSAFGNTNGTWELKGNDLTITSLPDPNDPDSIQVSMKHVIQSIDGGRMVITLEGLEIVLEKE